MTNGHTNRHRYLGNYPKAKGNSWTDELQGVAHDDAHWYFTRNQKTLGEIDGPPQLFKFPVGRDLDESVSILGFWDPSVARVSIPDHLYRRGYNHFGDLDYYQGYLFIAVSGKKPPIIVVYQAEDLAYVGYAALEDLDGEIGWCAINPLDQILYTSGKYVTATQPLIKYDIYFRHPADAQDPDSLVARYRGTFSLSPPYDLEHMQGGAFAPDGALYLVNGYDDVAPARGGITLYDREGNFLCKSSHREGPFKYEYHPDGPDYEEPEGLTYWDLDAHLRQPGLLSLAPKISGQLHVIMLDNDITGNDDLYFKHYRVYGGVTHFPVWPYLYHRWENTYPTKAQDDWWKNLCGVACDARHWYFAQANRLWKLPLDRDLGLPIDEAVLPSGIVATNIPSALSEYTQFRDLAYWNDYLLVPLVGEGVPPRLAVFDADDLSYIGSDVLMAQSDVVWCDVDSISLRLYSSGADITEDSPMCKYALDLRRLRDTDLAAGERVALVYQGSAALKSRYRGERELHGVRGGSFCAGTGELYLAHDQGLDVFDALGRLLDNDSWTDSSFLTPLGEPDLEHAFCLEGVTVRDLNDGLAPNVHGTVHVLAVREYNGHDEMDFLHYQVERPAYMGNRRSKEVHRARCSWSRLVSFSNRVPYDTLEQALQDGYDRCGHCLD